MQNDTIDDNSLGKYTDLIRGVFAAYGIDFNCISLVDAINISNGELYFTADDPKMTQALDTVKRIIDNDIVGDVGDDYYDSDYRKEKDARRILLQKILNIRGRTGNIEVHNMPTNKEVFFSDLWRVMDIVREEIETVVDFNIDFVIDFWNELHEVNY